MIGICNKEKRARSLSLVLIQESSKLKRLIAGHDTRKTLADLLYLNELAIRDRLAERVALLKMFKHKDEGNSQPDCFTKTYNLEDFDQILSNLSFSKIIEDHFNYQQSKISESLARDIAVHYVGELATLWKNEFRTLTQNKRPSPKDSQSQFNKLKKHHRMIGQKLINFIFNISKRSLYRLELRMDASKRRDGA